MPQTDAGKAAVEHIKLKHRSAGQFDAGKIRSIRREYGVRFYRAAMVTEQRQLDHHFKFAVVEG
jgi:hypothetical protein